MISNAPRLLQCCRGDWAISPPPPTQTKLTQTQTATILHLNRRKLTLTLKLILKSQKQQIKLQSGNPTQNCVQFYLTLKYHIYYIYIYIYTNTILWTTMLAFNYSQALLFSRVNQEIGYTFISLSRKFSWIFRCLLCWKKSRNENYFRKSEMKV